MTTESHERDFAETIDQTSQIVSAYVSHNALSAGELPRLISTTFEALTGLTGAPTAPPEPIKPAVPVRQSIKPDLLSCLHCAKKFKSLKRHLSTHHSQTADEYRATFGLPADYPMVAPNYSVTRSQLAKASGLGRKVAAATRGGKRK